MRLRWPRGKPWKQFQKVCWYADILSTGAGLVIANHFIMFIPGNFDGAIEHLTEAILLNPTSAIMYATRGRCLPVN